MYSFKFVLRLSLCFLMLGCSLDTSLTGKFILFMKSRSQAPESASGDANPTRLFFEVTNLQITDSEGQSIDLWEDREPISIIINDRDQIVFEVDGTKVAGKTLSNITMTLSASAKFSSIYQTEEAFSLTTLTYTFTDGLTCKTGSDCELYSYWNWKNILTRDSESKTDTLSTQPSLTITNTK